MNIRTTAGATSVVALLVAVGLAASVMAQEQGGAEGGAMPGMDHGQMEGMDQGAMGAGDTSGAGSPATQAYRAANVAMHEAMNFEYSDNADIDFARGMIGHHNGAIDMARIVLANGEDPDLRQLAEEIIEAQEAEIAFLQTWIAEHAE